MSDDDPTPTAVPVPARWQDLPEPVDPATVVASVPVTDAPDPDGGHDPNHEWMIRHG